MNNLFVVGTGRCGSTLVGGLLGQVDGHVVLHEALGMMDPARTLAAVSKPADFADALASPIRAATLFTSNNIAPQEMTYPFDRPGMRFSRSSGVPALSGTTLPSLYSDPDAALDEVAAHLRSLAPLPTPNHRLLASVFEFLARKNGAGAWVERSGGNLAYVDVFGAAFPESRFLHVYRNGHDVARSMARHPVFRLHLAQVKILGSCGVDIFAPEQWMVESQRLPEEFRWALPREFDREKYSQWQPEAIDFVRLWSHVLLRGVEDLSHLENHRVLHVSYDDLVSDPRNTLTRVARWLDLRDRSEEWIDRVIGSVVPRNGSGGPIDARCDRVVANTMRKVAAKIATNQ